MKVSRAQAPRACPLIENSWCPGLLGCQNLSQGSTRTCPSSSHGPQAPLQHKGRGLCARTISQSSPCP